VRRAWIAAVLVLVTSACGEQAAIVDAGRMGGVSIFDSDDRRAFVYLFSGEKGWNRALDDLASEVAKTGAVVVGVDLTRYLAAIDAVDEPCHSPLTDLEDWSHRLQRQLQFDAYLSPILAGIGAGATFARVVATEAPPATIAGAIAVDAAPALHTRAPLCTSVASRPTRDGFTYETATPLQAFLREPTGSGPAGDRLYDAVAQALDESTQSETLAGLPLVEMPIAGQASQFAVIYSGDGGWRDLDKSIGEYLVDHGTPVVGVDSLRYFWHEKTPAAIAEDLAKITAHYVERWQTGDVLLVGYSFGADILPFAVSRLPANERARVRQVSLLGLAPEAAFEIAVAGWLGERESDAQLVLPQLLQLDLSHVQCFYGEEEEDTLCREPQLKDAEIIRTAGGHHFDGDYDALARTILEGAKRRQITRSEVIVDHDPRE
jgi:type IV secretory pathway VirJ component